PPLRTVCDRHRDRRFDGARGGGGEAGAFGPGRVGQRVRLGPEDAAGGRVGEEYPARLVDEEDADALDVEDREQVLVATPHGSVDAVAIESNLECRTEIALVERLDHVPVWRRALGAVEGRRVRIRGQKDDCNGQVGPQL